jgi:hypothetical protein
MNIALGLPTCLKLGFYVGYTQWGAFRTRLKPYSMK